VTLINYAGGRFELLPDESVLECLERAGHRIPSFCRAGVCQSCVLRAQSGDVPAVAQRGLKESWKQRGLFLSCVCQPDTELHLTPAEVTAEFETHVVHVDRASEHVLRVLLQRPEGFRFEAGQYLQLIRPLDGLMRPYSIASLPEASTIELHVALLPGGQMSQWLVGALGSGVRVVGPFGDCVYVSGEQERPLLLAGTGTGLAPLLGVLRAALRAGHQGAISLYHGAVNRAGLYCWNALTGLQRESSNLRLVGSVLREDGVGSVPPEHPSIVVRPLEELVLDAITTEQRLYLCGHPEFVQRLRKKVFLAGLPLSRIHADAFVAPAARPA
jgi:ferredoxin-NADP reductase